jgi:predicted metal-dependent hydrolase
MEAELERDRKGIEQKLAAMQQSLSSQRTPEEVSSAGRFSIVRRSKKTPSLEDQWLDYCRMRLSRCAMLAASRFVRSIDAQVSKTADLLSELQHQLGLLSGAFDASASQQHRVVAEQPPASPVDEVRQFVARRLEEVMPRLAKELDQEIRAKFFSGNRRFCDVLTKDVDFRQSLVSALRHAARRAITRSLKEIDISRLLLSSDDRQTADQRLGVHLEKAAPRLLSCGGSRRLLVVLPDGCSDEQVREAVDAHVSESPTVAFDSDFDMVLCWEMREMPISRVGLALIDYRADYAQVASRLYTRVDVAPLPLTRCLQLAPQ